jgi:3-oxoacyl-[acyl-carrier-protein] synthase-3
VVVGPVGAGFGVLAACHRTDGSSPRTLIAGVRGGQWYDGRSVVHVADPEGARRVFLASVDQATEVIDGALVEAGLGPDRIDFFAFHHATPWIGRLIQDSAGLVRARTIDLYSRTAYVFATSVPLVLAAAEEAGTLVAGELAVLLAAGTGMMCGASVIRWGRTRS